MVTICNRTTVPLRLSDIGLWFSLEVEGLIMFSPCEKELTLMLVPLEKKQVSSACVRSYPLLSLIAACRSVSHRTALSRAIPRLAV